MLRKLWNDELGVIISAELVLVLTIAVLAMVVGLHAVSVTVVQELNDLSQAFGTIDQSFDYTGMFKAKATGNHSGVNGAGFTDQKDDCDCTPIGLSTITPKTDGSNTGNAENK